jgi:hypothetical protein
LEVAILASLLLWYLRSGAERPDQRITGGIVKKLNVLAVTIAMLSVPVAFACGVSDGVHNTNHVQGEKLDSGLGELTQAEINRIVAAASKRTVVASMSYAGYSPKKVPDVMRADYKVPPSNEGE